MKSPSESTITSSNDDRNALPTVDRRAASESESGTSANQPPPSRDTITILTKASATSCVVRLLHLAKVGWLDVQGRLLDIGYVFARRHVGAGRAANG